MQKYTQLSEENRYQIKALLEAGHNQSQIAEIIGVHRSTISRELKRNVANNDSTDKEYCPETAQQLTDQRTKTTPNTGDLPKPLKTRPASG